MTIIAFSCLLYVGQGRKIPRGALRGIGLSSSTLPLRVMEMTELTFFTEYIGIRMVQ